MKEFKINPLNVLGERRLEILPSHFTVVEVKNRIYHRDIVGWIMSNLHGRFFYGQLTKLVNDRIQQYDAIGFEDPRETTMFLLGYPRLTQ
jgi:hypothetical protein